MNVKEATEKFLTDLAVGHSKHTVSTYKIAMNQLVALGGERDVSTITPAIVPEFVRQLQSENPVSQSSLNVYLAALTRFYKWCVLSDLTAQDIIRFEEWVAQYRKFQRRRVPRLPNEGDVQKLFDFIRQARPDPERPEAQRGRDIILRYLRDRALLETLRCTGCRIDEACHMEIWQVEEKQATITGKGDKERTIFWDDVGWEALNEYLAAKDDDDVTWPVFSRHNWRDGASFPLSTNAARHLLAEWCRKAHVKVITPHQLRHRFGTLSLRSLGLAQVQDLMGHENPATTRIYTQLAKGELREAHNGVEY